MDKYIENAGDGRLSTQDKERTRLLLAWTNVGRPQRPATSKHRLITSNGVLQHSTLRFKRSTENRTSSAACEQFQLTRVTAENKLGSVGSTSVSLTPYRLRHSCYWNTTATTFCFGLKKTILQEQIQVRRVSQNDIPAAVFCRMFYDHYTGQSVLASIPC